MLTTAILCELCGKPPRNLFCTAQDAARAVGGQKRERLYKRFSQALARLTSAFKCPPELTAYLRRALPSVTANAEAALREGDAERLIFGAPTQEDCVQIVLPLSERMPDAAYARLVKQLTQCASAEACASQILRDIHSPADLFDVLRDASPGRECLWQVFAALPEALLAALCRQYPAPELLTDERERTLCETLSDFLASLSPDQRACIEAVARRIRLEP